MDVEEVTWLISKCLSGAKLKTEETQRLDAWKENSPDNALLLERLKDEDWIMERLAQFGRADTEKIWQMTRDRIRASPEGHLSK